MDTARTERPRKQAVVVVLITNEDPETRLHEVCFDDADVDEATLQANLDAEYEMLSEPEDELFADVAD